jgi:hypothetical protein
MIEISPGAILIVVLAVLVFLALVRRTFGDRDATGPDIPAEDDSRIGRRQNRERKNGFQNEPQTLMTPILYSDTGTAYDASPSSGAHAPVGDTSGSTSSTMDMATYDASSAAIGGAVGGFDSGGFSGGDSGGGGGDGGGGD